MEIIAVILLIIAIALLVVCFFYAIPQWFLALISIISITKHYKPSVNPWGIKNLCNPFNGIILIHNLTEEGQEKAKDFWLASFKFILACLIPLSFMYFTEQITGFNVFSK